MRTAIAHLSKIVHPNGVVFCLFHSEAGGAQVPVYSCSIASERSFSLKEVGRRQLAQEFSARRLEKLFPKFRAVNFYLKRDALLEVLAFR